MNNFLPYYQPAPTQLRMDKNYSKVILLGRTHLIPNPQVSTVCSLTMLHIIPLICLAYLNYAIFWAIRSIIYFLPFMLSLTSHSTDPEVLSWTIWAGGREETLWWPLFSSVLSVSSSSVTASSLSSTWWSCGLLSKVPHFFLTTLDTTNSSRSSTIYIDYWSALATAQAETSAEAKEAFNFNWIFSY